MTDEPNVTPVSPEDTARLLEMGEAVRVSVSTGVLPPERVAELAERIAPTVHQYISVNVTSPLEALRPCPIRDCEGHEGAHFSEYSPTPETWTA